MLPEVATLKDLERNITPVAAGDGAIRQVEEVGSRVDDRTATPTVIRTVIRTVVLAVVPDRNRTAKAIQRRGTRRTQKAVARQSYAAYSAEEIIVSLIAKTTEN
jgi:hypothetical protein